MRASSSWFCGLCGLLTPSVGASGGNREPSPLARTEPGPAAPKREGCSTPPFYGGTSGFLGKNPVFADLAAEPQPVEEIAPGAPGAIARLAPRMPHGGRPARAPPEGAPEGHEEPDEEEGGRQPGDREERRGGAR